MVAFHGRNNIYLAVALAVLLFVPVQQSQADLTAVGPVNAVSGFPDWYEAAGGVTLMIGNDPVLTFFDPVVPGNAFSALIGFGGEAFYYLADADLGIGFAEFAVEAAFQLGDPAPDQQLVFARLRVRIDVPVPGTYTLTHPYGVRVYNVAAVGPGPDINETVDETLFLASPPPTAPLSVITTPTLGPLFLQNFLVAVNPAPPAGFIGSFVALQTVTGSPTGNNFVRLEGPAGSNIGGPGVDVIETDQFGISGQLFDPNPPNNAPLALAQPVSVARGTPTPIVLTVTDPDGPIPPIFSIVSQPLNGALGVLNAATGQVTYVPNDGFTGKDSFTFVASDGLNVSAPATVTINVILTGSARPVFTPRLDIVRLPGLDNDRFNLRGRLSLGNSSNGINPMNEFVVLRVGRFSRTIPAGSFVDDGPLGFRFVGTLDGVALRVVIRPVGNDFIVTAIGRGLNLPRSARLRVALAVGDDSIGRTVRPTVRQISR